MNDGHPVPLQAPFSFSKDRNSPRLQDLPAFGQLANVSTFPVNEPSGDVGMAAFAQDWRYEVDIERLHQGKSSIHFAPEFYHNMYSLQSDEDDLDGVSAQDGDVEEQRSLLENTPSRTKNILLHESTVKNPREIALKPIKAERAANPSLPTHRKSLSDTAPPQAVEAQLNQQSGRNRFHTHKVPEHVRQETYAELQRPKSAQQVIHAPQPRSAQFQAAQFASKASSLHESVSEEESLPPHIPESPQHGTKRPLPTQELDFDPEDLKNKTIADLDAIDFSIDPRLPVNSQVMDSNGQAMTLSTKLTNLNRMRPEDQATLFRALSDAEREQTAEWFLDKFRTDTQRLMAVRVEKRKTALKYEMDVKKRERQVQIKKADVEEELVGLKKGGTELVRGKSPMK